jgi:uncharacterized protein YndB with AHSA1/START domain
VTPGATGATAVDAIRLAYRLPVSPADAFGTFTERMAAWWPPSETWSGDALESIGIEARAGGFWFERGPHGMRLDRGRVTTWEPPHRLVVSWQLGIDGTPVPNPARASEVDVTFEAEGDGCQMTLRHFGFERHGADGARYRDVMASESGWPAILARYVAAIERRTEAPWEGLTT